MGLFDLLAGLGPDALAEKRKQAMQAKVDSAGNFLSSLLAPTTGTFTEGLSRALPITGEAWAANDAGNAASEGNYGQAALMGGLGLLPFGSLMAKPIGKSIANIVRREAPQAEAMRLAQQRAALPIEQNGLGLGADNTAMQRASAMFGLTRENAAENANKVGNLTFSAIPNSDFKGSLLHQSPTYNNKKGSAYRLSKGDDQNYMRQADHWGDFGTNVIEGSPEAKALSQISSIENDDPFGRIGKALNNWQLTGGYGDINSAKIEDAYQKYSASKLLTKDGVGDQKLFDAWWNLRKKAGRETGSIPVDSLVGKLPEKTYQSVTEDGARFSAPLISTPDNVLRSRFAAFDPWRRNALIAASMGVAAPDLLAAENR